MNQCEGLFESFNRFNRWDAKIQLRGEKNMKIVLFGPERRIGAWQNDKVIDLNRALANYLRDQRRD